MKSVKELSAVRSVFWNGDHNDDPERKGYAVGFTSSDFIIWNLTTDTKVLSFGLPLFLFFLFLTGASWQVSFLSPPHSSLALWLLNSHFQVLKVACGGWRRPHSFYIGNFPETNTCFAFVKVH